MMWRLGRDVPAERLYGSRGDEGYEGDEEDEGDKWKSD